MIIQDGFGAYGTTQDDIDVWCSSAYPNDPVALAKCKGGPTFSPPWTAVGALLRGIPWHGADLTSAAATVASGTTAKPATQKVAGPLGVLGLSKGMLYGGVAILGLGAVVAVLTKKKGGRRR